jgi:hypothetical protein
MKKLIIQVNGRRFVVNRAVVQGENFYQDEDAIGFLVRNAVFGKEIPNRYALKYQIACAPGCDKLTAQVVVMRPSAKFNGELDHDKGTSYYIMTEESTETKEIELSKSASQVFNLLDELVVKHCNEPTPFCLLGELSEE